MRLNSNGGNDTDAPERRLGNSSFSESDALLPVVVADATAGTATDTVEHRARRTLVRASHAERRSGGLEAGAGIEAAIAHAVLAQ